MSAPNAALQLVPRTSVLPSANDWSTMMAMAETLYRSGVLPEHIKNPAAVVAIVQKGKELSIPPMHALQNIAFIKGKTTLQAELMLALVIRDEGAGALRVVKTDNTACTVDYKRAGNEGTYTFTIDDARAAGLVSPGGMYTKYPAAMLRSRCISAVCRFVFPDIIGGMYTQEEMGATISEDGEVLALPDERPERASIATSTPIEQPRSAPIGSPRNRPMRDDAEIAADEKKAGHPTLVTDAPFHNQMEELAKAAAARGIPLTYGEDDVRVKWGVLIELIQQYGGPKVPVGNGGRISPKLVWDALNAIPTVDLETGEVLREEAAPVVDEYADIAAATDAGTTLPLVRD
jgi:hypothetical protein